MKRPTKTSPLDSSKQKYLVTETQTMVVEAYSPDEAIIQAEKLSYWGWDTNDIQAEPLEIQNAKP